MFTTFWQLVQMCLEWYRHQRTHMFMTVLYLQYLMRTGWFPKCNANMKAAKSPLVTLITVNFWILSLRLPRRCSSDIVLKGSKYLPCILWKEILLKKGMLFPDHLNVSCFVWSVFVLRVKPTIDAYFFTNTLHWCYCLQFSREKTVKILTQGGEMLELCYELRTPFVMSIADNQVCEKLVSFLCFHLCECVCFYFVFLYLMHFWVLD